MRCDYTPEGVPFSHVEWFKGNTSDILRAERVFYYSRSVQIQYGGLVNRSSVTHTKSTIGLIINKTEACDDGIYFGRIMAGVPEHCHINYKSRSKYLSFNSFKYEQSLFVHACELKALLYFQMKFLLRTVLTICLMLQK